YYQAKNHQDDPVTALARKTPSHAGTHPSISVALEQALNAQYRHHTIAWQPGPVPSLVELAVFLGPVASSARTATGRNPTGWFLDVGCRLPRQFRMVVLGRPRVGRFC
ncbi:MAG: hypothetical protein MJE77_38730, partial [Proteobacteria bacterium]|nr:hypothetical protein [Pseudomonadota bacterium]